MYSDSTVYWILYQALSLCDFTCLSLLLHELCVSLSSSSNVSLIYIYIYIYIYILVHVHEFYYDWVTYLVW